MLRLESSPAATEFRREVERIALPLDAGGSHARAFTTLMNEVRSEVNAFIANGSASSSGLALSVEGNVQRARSQGAGPTVDAQQEFISSVTPWARAAADRLGVAPELVVAHAALESGWGQQPLRGTDGSTTNNLFGIKAGGNWNGAVADVMTTEVTGGARMKQEQPFRSYADMSSAFGDYAQVLLDNPRFSSALHNGNDAQAFAEGLVRGKYATDPDYASKLESVARRVHALGVAD
jgi:flagellar protein FlgJ